MEKISGYASPNLARKSTAPWASGIHPLCHSLISLIVGGLVLFSTLLISIQEKMTEIGIRKASVQASGIYFYISFSRLWLVYPCALLGASLPDISSVMGKLWKTSFSYPGKVCLVRHSQRWYDSFLVSTQPWKPQHWSHQAIYYHEKSNFALINLIHGHGTDAIELWAVGLGLDISYHWIKGLLC
jgi:hypothetical protein